jgi:hypothetical protein
MVWVIRDPKPTIRLPVEDLAYGAYRDLDGNVTTSEADRYIAKPEGCVLTAP